MDSSELRAYAVGRLRPGQGFYLEAADLAGALVFEDRQLVAPTEPEIAAAAAQVAAQVAQAEAARLVMFDRFYRPACQLIGRSPQSLTFAEMLALWSLERYTSRTVTLNAEGQIAEVPGAEHAPMVYPVLLRAAHGAPWLVGTDNQAAWAAFVAYGVSSTG